MSKITTDGLKNVVANLGTSRDKASFNQYDMPLLSIQEMINAYRGTWLARKVVDIPALDSCRAWREWQAGKDEIEVIEEEERRLGLKNKMLDARIRARLTGGSAILIGDGDADPSKPLNPETIGLGGLKYLTVFSRNQLAAGRIERDISSPSFMKPEYYTLTAAGGGEVLFNIHPSRLVILQGVAPADEGYVGSLQGWGESVLLSLIGAIKNLDATTSNIASLIFEAKVDTVGIPGLMQNLMDPAYERRLIQRWRLAEIGKGVNGALVHDSEEILGQKTASFAGLPDLLDRFMQMVSGAADIPMTRLMGQAPAGMSSTGESDMRNYYDRISAAQELEMGPAMAVLDECLVRSALGSRPPEVDYEWSSLWITSDKDRADTGKTHAETIKMLVDSGVIPLEALGKSAVNIMTQSGVMPGLEGEVDRYYADNPDDPMADPELKNIKGVD